ncbi:MAG: protein kinase [Planctomycetia bacterium]|nr:protein kinase [Planctomycetia bacterium]
MPQLLVEKGPNKGQAMVLSGSGPFHIGRDPACAFVLNDSNVSRKHAELVSQSGAWSVRDLASRNGTYLNGRRLAAPAKLQVGDRLQTGEILISFLDEREGKDQGGLIGMRVGGYRIIERLGRGGMGTVYKANQIALNREVALKVLSPDLIQEEMFRNLFIAEARTAAAFNHPNIVQIHDVGVEGGLHYFSMELMPNGSVHELLVREGRLPPARALRIAMDAAAGLAYAQRKGIVHRDIKPENLMIGETGIVKIGDLGLAFHVGKSEVDDEVGVMGTPHFCAPEQVTRGKLDHRTDLYALGASMYRMLAGRPPFVGQTLKEILVRKVKEKPVPLTEAVKGLPPAVNDLVMQLLERNPAERPQSAEEVRGRIEAILPDLEGALVPSGNTTRREASGGSTFGSSASLRTPATAAAAPPEHRATATVAWLAVASLLLASAVGLLGWQFLKGRAPKDPGSSSNGSTGARPEDPSVPRPPTDQDLANEMQLEIAKWVSETRPEKPTRDWANAAAMRYENLVEKYPATPAAASARIEIARLRGTIREMAAEDAYKGAQAFEEECGEKFQGTLNVVDLVPAAERYEQVARDYDGTRAAADAFLGARDVRARMAAANEAKAEWNTARETADRHVRAAHFAEALLELGVFTRKFRDSGWDELSQAEHDRVSKTAWEHFEAIASGQLNDLVQAKDWEGARKLLGEMKGRYGIEGIEMRIADTQKKVAELSAVVTPPTPVKTDAQLEAEALAQGVEMEVVWRFSEAATVLRETREKVQAADAKARLAAAAEDAELQEAVRRALKSHANGNDRDDSGMQSRKFRGSTIVSSSETGLKLEDGSEVAWAKITAPEAFRLAYAGWPVSAREALGLSLMLIRASSWRCARFSAMVAAHRDPLLSAASKAMADRADREERSRVPSDPLASRLYSMERDERKAADDAADRIVASMNKAREWQGMGEVYSGMQLFDQSDELLKRALDAKPSDTEDIWRAELFLALNAAMRGNEGEYRAHAFKARNQKPDESHSRWIKAADEMWKNLVDTLVRADELRLAMATKPDATKAGDLLKLHDQRMHLLVDQRVVARWLVSIEEWRRDEFVRTGEPQRLLAETCAVMKDYYEAKKMYEKLRKSYPTHEWCITPENGTRRVDEEWSHCDRMIKKWRLGR